MATPTRRDPSSPPGTLWRTYRRAHAWAGRQIVGFKLIRVAAGPGSALKLLLATLTMPVKKRSPWRNSAYRVTARVNGAEANIRLAGPTDFLVMREILCDEEYKLPDGFKAKNIVDLGAHIGLSSLYLATALDAPKIVAVEADPALVERTRQNTAGHDVTVLNAAISTTSGRRPFFTSDESWANSFERTLARQREIEIDTVTIDDAMRAGGFDRVDLLKIDVEGAEWDLLDNRAFTRNVDAIVGELHAAGDRPPRELIEVLERDFAVEVLREDHETAIFRAFRR